MPVLAGDECLFSGNLGTDTDRLKLAVVFRSSTKAWSVRFSWTR